MKIVQQLAWQEDWMNTAKTKKSPFHWMQTVCSIIWLCNVWLDEMDTIQCHKRRPSKIVTCNAVIVLKFYWLITTMDEVLPTPYGRQPVWNYGDTWKWYQWAAALGAIDVSCGYILYPIKPNPRDPFLMLPLASCYQTLLHFEPERISLFRAVLAPCISFIC